MKRIKSGRDRRGGIRGRFLLAILLAAVSGVSAAQGVDHPQESQWQQVCERAKQQPLVVAEPAGPLPADQLPKCDEMVLYYGIGRKPDYAAALQCGWFHRAHVPVGDGNMFRGPGVLTMLYANGKGVTRNYDLALRFACEQEWAAPNEMELRIGHLEQLRDAGENSATLDLCDDQTSGLSQGTCTLVQTSLDDVERARKVDVIVQGLPGAVKSAFAALQIAEAAFETARCGNEVNLSGSGREAFFLEEQAALRDQFLDNLQKFGRGSLPPASDADQKRLDRDLNTLYRQIQNSPDSKWEFTTVHPVGIKDTERKWIALADAWLAFGRLAYPSLSAAQVRAELIRQRLDQLREFSQ